MADVEDSGNVKQESDKFSPSSVSKKGRKGSLL